MGVLVVAVADGVEHVRAPPVALVDHVLHRRLEAAPEVHDEVGVEEVVDLVGGQLHVVGLGAGGGEIGDLDGVAPDPLGQLGQGEEAGHHPGPAVPVATVLAAARGHGEEGHDGGGEDPGHGHSGERE